MLFFLLAQDNVLSQFFLNNFFFEIGWVSCDIKSMGDNVLKIYVKKQGFKLHDSF